LSILIKSHIQQIIMPSTIRPGFKVQARVGPFSIETFGDNVNVPSSSQPSDGKKKQKRRVRSVITGWVVSAGRDTSTDKHSWRVLWSNCGKTCDHLARSLTVVNDDVDGFEKGIFERLLPSDYLWKKEQLFAVFASGRYESKLRMTPVVEPSTNTYTADPLDEGKLKFAFIFYTN
jgi:hypothetical protein